MGKIQHHILTLCLVFASMLASLSACSDSDVPGGGQAGGGDTFSLALDVTIPVMPGSRATYEQGVGDYENTIDLAAKDYRILLFSGDDKLLVEFKTDDVVLTENTPLASNPTYRSYRVTAEVDKSITEYTALKLVVLANCGDYPTLAVGATTIDDLAGYAVSNGAVSTAASTTFNGADHLQNTQGNHIPMFGVKDCQGIAWLKNDLTWFGNLWLLRAVAKIEVRSAVGSPKIESVTLTHYNEKGTCAPKAVYQESDYVIDGQDKYKDLGYLTLPDNKNNSKGSLSVEPDVQGVYVVYVPEYQILQNPSAPQGSRVDDYARLNVFFDGINHEYNIDFKYYTEDAAKDNDANVGDFFDIKRNFYYKYTLNLKDPANLDMEVIVIPYIETVLNPDFGLLPEQPDPYADFQPVYSKFEDELFYTDGTAPDYKDATGFLGPDRQTLISNPAENLDPVTGWWKISATINDRDVLFFYYDPVNKIQYAPDRKSKVRTVFSQTVVGYLAYLELDDSEELTGADNYYDAWHDLWYDLPPSKGYYVDRSECTNPAAIGYVYNTNSVQLINNRTKKPVEFISIEKSIEVTSGVKYLLDTDGKRVKDSNNNDVMLKIILLASPYPQP